MLQDEPSDPTMIPQWSCCEHLWAILALGEGLVWGASTRLCSNHFTGTPHTLYSTAEKLTKPGTHAASLTDPSRCLWCFLEQHLIREGCTVLHYPIAETDPILKTIGTYWQATHVVRSIKEPFRERKKCLFEVYNRGLEDGGCKCADGSNVRALGWRCASALLRQAVKAWRSTGYIAIFYIFLAMLWTDWHLPSQVAHNL